MDNFKFETNKLIIHSDPWALIKKLSLAKNNIIITPNMHLTDLLKLDAHSWILAYLNDEYPDYQQTLFNEDEALKIQDQINNQADEEIMDYQLDILKLFKTLFRIKAETFLTIKTITFFVDLAERYTQKELNIFCFGFGKNLNTLWRKSFNNLNLILINDHIDNIGLEWLDIGRILIYNDYDIVEIEQPDQLKSFLENATKTVLGLKDLNGFLAGDNSFNSFLIANAIRKI